MTKKMTTDEFVAKARATHGDAYDYSKTLYSGGQHKVVVLCREHGEFPQCAADHIRGSGCPVCARGVVSAARTQGSHQILIRLQAIQPAATYTYPDLPALPVKVTDLVRVVCPEHGEFQSRPHKLLKGQGCPACGRLRSREGRSETLEGFILKARSVHGNTYDYAQVDYQGATEKVTIGCPRHGPFEQAPQSHYLQGSGCPKCGAERRAQASFLPFSEFVARAREVHGNKYDYPESGYRNVSADCVVICATHGQFPQRAADHLDGAGCPTCSRCGPSKGQREIAEFLESLGEVVTLDHNYGRGTHRRQFDVWVADRKLAVEFDGLYFHSTKFKAAYYHQQKRAEAEALGVDLIQVFSDEWEKRGPQVRAILIGRLGRLEKVGARECQVRELDSTTAEDFYNTYHVQGGVRHGTSVGLFHREALVAVMTLSQSYSRRGVAPEDGVWELARFASALHISGGASRLFSDLVRRVGARQVTSFSDNRLFRGGVYQHLGFARDGQTEPDYKYVGRCGLKRLSKSGFQHKHLPEKLGEKYDPELSERENCEQAGFYRIYDCGLTRWVWQAG